VLRRDIVARAAQRRRLGTEGEVVGADAGDGGGIAEDDIAGVAGGAGGVADDGAGGGGVNASNPAVGSSGTSASCSIIYLLIL